MRKDLEIHIQTGDVNITPQNKHLDYPFSWVGNPNGLLRYIYGEIEVPASLPENTIRNKGVCCVIPYTGKYKEFYVRIKRVYSETEYAFLQNPVDGSEWFLVKSGLYGTTPVNAYACQLRKISEGSFRIMFDKGTALIYSGDESDMNIIKANRQNANLMLACVPTNNYRYPLTGVGLIRWRMSSMFNTDLADVLAREFAEDGTPVISASFNHNTQQMQLELDTVNVDNE